MKKLITLLAAMVMCVNLVACSGVDVQPAIDSYNELADNYNEFVDVVNADIESVPAEDIEFFNSLADVINEYGAKLEDGTEFTQEEVDEMVEMFDELNGIIEESLADFQGE